MLEEEDWVLEAGMLIGEMVCLRGWMEKDCVMKCCWVIGSLRRSEDADDCSDSV